jgi:molybdopterin molybdotransferase
MALLTFDEALESVLSSAAPLSTNSLPPQLAAGKFLAAGVYSTIDLPRFENSQMDGYAVSTNDIASASKENPVILPVTGTSAAGHPTVAAAAGDAIRIFTGAPMPESKNAVVPVEDVEESAEGAAVSFYEPAMPGQFVRIRGEDVVKGALVSRAGDLVTAGRLALLLSAGCVAVDVHRRARVVVVTNGDELMSTAVRPDDLTGGQIYESNGVMLRQLLIDAGADVVGIVSAPDRREEISATIQQVVRNDSPDLIISSGGVSGGDRDYVRSVVAELGSITFWRASIRPGKPILFGSIEKAHFLGLPGNPASTLVTFELFARPLLARLHGDPAPIRFFPTRLAVEFRHQPGRRSFVRSTTTVTNSGLVSAPSGGQGSHFVTSLAGANSLVVIPEMVSQLDAGSNAYCLLTGPLEVE